jgi:hypothetical protein
MPLNYVIAMMREPWNQNSLPLATHQSEIDPNFKRNYEGNENWRLILVKIGSMVVGQWNWWKRKQTGNRNTAAPAWNGTVALSKKLLVYFGFYHENHIFG